MMTLREKAFGNVGEAQRMIELGHHASRRSISAARLASFASGAHSWPRPRN